MDILTSSAEGILQIVFNRPEKKNAITAAMYQMLADALAEGNAEASVRAIVLSGSAEVFTAGNDLEDFQRNPPTGGNSAVFQFLHAISHAEKPLVAAVCGPAVGVGTTLLLHCDMVYAGSNASFKLPFAALGLVPEAASSLLLPQLLGYQRAAELLLLGESFDAQRAEAMGLVNKILPARETLDYALAQAAKLASLPPAALKATKRLMKSVQNAQVEEHMAKEGEEFRARLVSPEAREAFRAFFERRKPDFSAFS